MCTNGKNQKAGQVCTICDGAPCCTQSFKIIKKLDTLVNFPAPHKDKVKRIPIFVVAKQTKLTAKLTPTKCRLKKADCPSTVVTQVIAGKGTELARLKPGALETSFNVEHSDTYNTDRFGLWEWVQEAFNTKVDNIAKNTYKTVTTDCGGTVQTTYIDVYPEQKITISLAFGNSRNLLSEEERRRRHTYSPEDMTRIRNNPRQKWSQIGRYIFEQERTQSFEIKAKIAGRETVLGTESSKPSMQSTNKGGVAKKAGELIRSLGNRLFASKGGATDLGVIKAIDIIGPNIKITGTKELKQLNSKPYYEYDLTLGLDPLIGLVVVVDLIAVLLAVLGSPGASNSWKKLRETMEDMQQEFDNASANNKSVAGYAIFYVDLTFTASIFKGEVKVNNAINPTKPQLVGQMAGELDLELKAGIEAGMRVLFVQGSFAAIGKASGGGSIGLRADSKGLGAYIAYKPLRAKFSFSFKAGYSTNGGAGTSTNRNGGRTNTNSGGWNYELGQAEVEFCESGEFGPLYFINF